MKENNLGDCVGIIYELLDTGQTSDKFIIQNSFTGYSLFVNQSRYAEIMRMENINWDEVLSGGFVQIEDGSPKTMDLRNWRMQKQFKDNDGNIKPGVVFDVYSENDVVMDAQTKKEWTVTSKRALALLKPLIEEAVKASLNQIIVTVIAVGDGMKRTYSIKKAQ